MKKLNKHSKKELIKENYNAKLVLVGHDILFPKILSLAFESLKIRTIAVQERFLPTFFSYRMFCIDTYLCGSEFICKILEKSNDKLVNNCIPCGQTRTDILINYQHAIELAKQGQKVIYLLLGHEALPQNEALLISKIATQEMISGG